MILPLIIGVVIGYAGHNIIHTQTKVLGRKLRHKTAAAQTKRWTNGR